MIHEGAARLLEAHRPAHRMGDLALVMVFRLHFPDLFHTKAKLWHIACCIQIVLGNDLLGQRAPHSFGKEYIFAIEFHTRLISLRRAAIGILAKFTGHHTFHRAIVMKQQLGTGHAGENFNAQLFGLFGEPTAHIAHRNDVIAVIVHQRWHDRIGQTYLPRLAQDIEVVFLHFGIQGRALGFPIWDQCVEGRGIQHGAREDMRTHF